MRGRNSYGNYTNPCLTMHQPWASLLVYGIKRIEGRSWPSPIRGRLWIHAASKVPDEATIKAMEDFYREVYALNGVNDLNFPEHYPVSRLLGCVEVVGCLEREELAGWEMVPEGVRLEAQTDFCWLCEQPQKLLIPFEMRGYQGVYNLEKKIYEAAVRGLTPAECLLPVKFPIPDPRDRFSLKPGSVAAYFPKSKGSEVQKSSNLDAAITGARAAATQFSKKDQVSHTTQNTAPNGVRTRHMKSNIIDKEKTGSTNFSRPSNKDMTLNNEGKADHIMHEGSSSDSQPPSADSRPHSGAPSKIFAAALRGLKPS
ncbi:Ribosome biogenesis factor NIP7-like [Parasponia andersonii]|uniref:Ribosome biogenesis factor NIP7-like n=1 Tax=Parasponia andersonii TaxID=3476 RepID=A0A2P5C322_PARAD|nr:Ribosome biogenesis factor NIP7-like [Parasponia andersonii]